MLKEITKKQFDAYCYVRQPLIRAYAKEVAWFEAKDRTPSISFFAVKIHFRASVLR